jgi:hypothetical protein
MKIEPPQQLELFVPLAYERRPTAPPDLRCLDCRRVGEWYMLRDPVWLEANPPDDGLLCPACVETRLGRQLVGADFAITPAEMAQRVRSDSQEPPR